VQAHELAEKSALNLPGRVELFETSDHESSDSPGVPLHSTIMQDQAGTILLDRYKLLQQIGEGGMGTVWMADQLRPVRRRVAVKLIRADRGTSKQILARFEAERQAIAVMDHPNIAKLLDAGTSENGSPFFVMELVKGIALTEYCDQARLSVHERLQLFSQVCYAVQHAHQKGIIHRDLKPSNILVENHDGVPVPKVIDFGLAKASSGMKLSDQTLFTGFGAVLGTPMYMAPEQIGGSAIDIDTRADIYALGVILFELLTGSTPITRESLKEAALDQIMKLIREHEPPTPSSRLSSTRGTPSVAANRHTEPQKLSRFVKGDLDWIVMKALAKERERRYESSGLFAKDIERFLNQETVLAGPPTTAYRLKKFLIRNRVRVAVAVMLSLALIGGLIGTSWGWLEAKRQTEIAVREADAKEKARAAEVTQRQRAEVREREAVEAKHQAERAAESERLAREEAERERAAKEQEARYAKVIADFVRDDFLALTSVEGQLHYADPNDGYELSKDTTLKQLLDRAADKLNRRNDLAPATEASLRWMIGESYRGLGDYPRAVEFLRRALALHRDLHGTQHAESLAVELNLADATLSAGFAQEAVHLFQSVVDSRTQALGADHLDTLNSLLGLANGMNRIGELRESARLYEQVVEQRTDKLGRDHPDTIRARLNLASCYLELGRYEESLALQQDAWEKFTQMLGADHPHTILSLSSLAHTQFSIGHPEKAIDLYKDALKLLEKKLGVDHPRYFSAINDLGLCHQALGDLEHALPLYEQALELRKNKLGPDHPDTLKSMDSLAIGYYGIGKLDQAKTLWEQLLSVVKAKLGLEHPETLEISGKLAVSFQDAGLIEQAIELFEEIIPHSRNKLGADHPDTLTLQNNLANAYQAHGRIQQAIELYEEILAKRTVKLGRDHPHTLSTLSGLGTCYSDAGELEKALEVLVEVLAGRQAKYGPDHPQTLVSLNNVAMANRLAGHIEEAISVYLQALELLKSKYGSDHPHTIICMAGLAETYTEINELERAISIWEAALNGMKKVFGVKHPNTLQCMSTLGTCYSRTGRWEDAAKLNEQLMELAEANLGANHPNTLVTKAGLGMNYLELGKNEKGIGLLEDVVDNFPDPTQLTEVMQHLQAAYLRVERKTDYDRLAKQRLSLARQQMNSRSEEFADLLADLGAGYLQLKSYSDAETVLKESLLIRKQLSPENWTTHHVGFMLGQALLEQPSVSSDEDESENSKKRLAEEAESLLNEAFGGLMAQRQVIPESAIEKISSACERLKSRYTELDQSAQAELWSNRQSTFNKGSQAIEHET
jgi:serine/threonine protein kinase/tetratricopeptide (TPR) repeat protein